MSSEIVINMSLYGKQGGGGSLQKLLERKGTDCEIHGQL